MISLILAYQAWQNGKLMKQTRVESMAMIKSIKELNESIREDIRRSDEKTHALLGRMDKTLERIKKGQEETRREVAEARKEMANAIKYIADLIVAEGEKTRKLLREKMKLNASFNRKWFNFTILISFFLLYGCSVQKVAIKYAGDLFDAGVEAIFSETDYEIAKSSIPANLKLLEAIYNVDPSNQKIVLLLVQGYTGYAMGFVEDESPERASTIYKRALEYGMNFLKSKSKKFSQSLSGDFEKFEKALRSEFDRDDVPMLLWTAIAWGSYVNLNRNDPDAIGQIPKIEAMVKYSVELDESYFYGSGDMFLGVLLSSRPKMFGGDPDKGKEYFERCIKFTDGKYLLPYVFYARYYAVQVQDRELFEALLNRVIDSPVDLLKRAELLNLIAKRKAEKFKSMVDELF